MLEKQVHDKLVPSSINKKSFNTSGQQSVFDCWPNLCKKPKRFTRCMAGKAICLTFYYDFLIKQTLLSFPINAAAAKYMAASYEKGTN